MIAGPEAKPVPVRIAALEVDRRQIRATLAPYQDATCGCQMHAEFKGALSGDFIVGTMAFRNPSGEEVSGDWSAERILR